MRVLQINIVYKVKSTGRTCYEVEKFLISHGHDCVTAYGFNKHADTERNGNSFTINNRFEYYMHNFLSRLTGLEGYFSYFPTKRLIRFMEKYKPDIVHLRNLHGHYLNLGLLFKYLAEKKIPVIQNLHDMWAFTGGCCHYTELKCNKWQSTCCNCPSKKNYPQSWFFDWTSKMRKDKEFWYTNLHSLTVVAVSRWVAEETYKSFFKNIAEIIPIYNWINQNVFRVYNDLDDIREQYDLPKNKFIIIGVSSSWDQGTPRFEDFLKISSRLHDDEVLVMVGETKSELSTFGIKHIPFTNDTVELAKLYNCADVFVHCSVEDTFGKVIAEAMSCGTPAIVYNTTGCKELVDNDSGFIVEPRSIDEIMDKIAIIKANGKNSYTEKCINNAKNRFNYEKNIEVLYDVYKKLSSEMIE